MSKTDKTKPWRVRVAEHHPWAWHNHENGICTLPSSPLAEGGLFSNRGCYWSDWNLCYKGNCCYGCGCRLCTGYWERRWERRRDRHQARQANRKLLKAWPDID